MSALSTLRTSVRRLINEEDSDDSHFTNDEINDYLNQATMFLGTQMEWPLQTSIASSVEDQALYSLPDDFISLVDVYFDNTKLDVLEREDLSAINPNWQDSASEKPRVVYKADNAVIGLYPAPNADNSNLNIQIQYIQVPATLSSDSDIPDLHTAFQMCLPFYAAFLCETKIGNDKKAQTDLQYYETHKKALMSKLQRFSDDLYRFRWTVG